MTMFEYFFGLFIASWSSTNIFMKSSLYYLITCSLAMQGADKYIIFSKRIVKSESTPIYFFHVQIY